MAKIYIKNEGDYVQYLKVLKKNQDTWSGGEISSIYVKTQGSWSPISQSSTIFTLYAKGGAMPTEYDLSILGPSTITANTCSLVALYGFDDVSSSSTWSITSGSEYATISNDGTITVSTAASASQVSVQANYFGLTATKDVSLTYKGDTPSETTVEISTDISGNTIITETVTTNNEDGSYSSESTSYNEDGDPISGKNTSGDTNGNISTQGVKYDDSGNTTVTSYTIDTSESTSSGKTFNADGVNTEYYAFDVTHGFILDLNFTIDFVNQPAGQNENYNLVF